MWKGFIYCTICEQDNVEVSLVKWPFLKAAVWNCGNSLFVLNTVIGKLMWKALHSFQEL